MFLFHITQQLTIIEQEIGLYYKRSGYIAPLRAEANRYYRNMGLQVDDIDAFGRNLPEFIASLSSTMKNSLNDFLKKTLGITIFPSNQKGHISILLKNEAGSFNLADTGFGYSQILPVLVKLWHIGNMSRFRARHIILSDIVDQITVMEQPELHLHPAMQARLTDAFVSAVTHTKEDIDIRSSLMLETHSPVIVNRIGRCIREGMISHDDVNVVMFNKQANSNKTELKQIHYNEKGIITEWPFGFFDPTDD